MLHKINLKDIGKILIFVTKKANVDEAPFSVTSIVLVRDSSTIVLKYQSCGIP